ncbi:signal transducing adapter molecule 2-like [Saccostrea cucullata]|uniref:signal transducing adapter molecule 2-like n=1 Tax=Saccostrea cuccullata TaxID=36930 RepID=UPI002ED50CA5
MPLFTPSTPFDGDVEKATSEMNTEENWAVIMDIVDKVNTTNGSKDCLQSIAKRLNHRVPFVAMQALTLLDACVNNCGKPFHLEISSRDFISECRTLINQKAHPKVAQRLKLMIKKWAESKEFRDEPTLSLIPSFYNSLKSEGVDFSDQDAPVKKSTQLSSNPDVANSQQEEDDLAKAIALSLRESEKSTTKTTSLYPTGFNSSAIYATSSKPKEVRKVRALYDFEAAEDNELTFKSGEFISVTDDSDTNWWKGFNHRGEGLFPANFVTSDLTVEPEESKAEKAVSFKEEVQVLDFESDEVTIDEGKIDEVLQLIQNADPTGETQPDSTEMLRLENQCSRMGPLIDTELEKIDKKHASLCELNSKVVEAMQLYHNLMKETPAPYGYKTQHPAAPMNYNFPSQSVYNGQPQFQPGPGQMPPSTLPQGSIPVGQMPLPQGSMPQNLGMIPPNVQMPQNQMNSSVPQQMSMNPQNYMPQVPSSQPYSSSSDSSMNAYNPSVQSQSAMPPSHNQSMPQQVSSAQSGAPQQNFQYTMSQMDGRQFYQPPPQQQPLL